MVNTGHRIAEPPENPRGNEPETGSPRAGSRSGTPRWLTLLREGGARWFWPIVSLLFLGLAFAVLHRELKSLRWRDIAEASAALPAASLVGAALLSALAYAIMPCYDALALAYIRRPMPLPRLGFGSFIAYAMSNTLGFAMLTGGTVRYRFWSAWGLSTEEIAKAVTFSTTTFAIGLASISGFALLLEPSQTARLIGIPTWLPHPLGVLALAFAAAYLGWSAWRRRPIRLGGWEFPVPGFRMALSQIVVAAVDWSVAGSVLFVLLPEADRPGFAAFLGVFLLAQFAGLLSHVPGGLGVFETIMVVLLDPYLPPGPVLGALVAFRAIYYLAPFSLGLLLLVGYEALHRQEQLLSAAQRTGITATRWMSAILPHVLGGAVFAAGVLLLVSGSMPAVHARIHWLRDLVPLGVIEASHVAAGMIGAMLVVLGWGLTRRLDAAYALAIALLTAGIGAALLRGLDWEEAVVLVFVLALLLPCRPAFHRHAALTREPFTPGWIIAVTIVFVATIWIGLLAYRHIDYANTLWLHFSTRGDAPRFLRATLGAFVVLFAFALLRLFRYAEAEPALPGAEDLERARTIVARSEDTMANLALLGDKALLFSKTGNAFLMYAVEGRSWVALGDPIGPLNEWEDLVWCFREQVHRHGGWTVFYEIGPESLPLCVDLGLTLLKLGEEARVPLNGFSLEGGSRKSLRRRCRDLEQLGATFEVCDPAEVPGLLPRLRRISDAWLAAKNTREKAFSLGRFDETYLSNFPMALVVLNGEPIAFANVLCGAGKAELSIDLMRYVPDAPPGIMDYLIVSLMEWGRDRGVQWFNLGMAPLSGLENRALAPLWNRLGALVFRLGEHFYNFQGLREYKEKFDPVWRPRYLASPGGLALPRILANVATLISGGVRGLMTK